MFRRHLSAALVGALALSLVGTAMAAPPPVEDNITGWSILTPGQSGTWLHPDSTNQNARYASLADDDDITEDELSTYFHPLQFSDATGNGLQPAGRTDVTIYRGADGVPEVFGDTDAAMAFGVGYASAQDRMFQMDAFRHVARGEGASFLGGSFLASDKIARRDGYTGKELKNMYDDFDNRFGANGAELQSMLAAYVDGVNAFIDSALAPGGETVPGEYGLTGNELNHWTIEDSIALTVFQGRSFGGDGGEEISRAEDLLFLQSRHGDDTGRQIWEDLLFASDPDSYPTIPEAEGTFPSPLWGEPNDKAIAIPDKVKYLAQRQAKEQRVLDRTVRRIGFPTLASNGIVVAGSHTESGDPIHYGAPQVGYAIPSFLYEIEGHSPNYDFAGPTVPGGGPSVVLGRTAHLAWMIPVGVGDMIDERAEKLCSKKKGKKGKKGKKVKKNSQFYMYKGKCIKMEKRTEKIDDGDGKTIKLKVFRTVHGPVVARGTVKGKPVAFSQQRTTWLQEPDLLMAFTMWAMNSTDTVEEFAEGVEVFPMSFHILYADMTQTAYFYGGHHAIRADGVDRRLPSWGTGKWEWQGFMSEEQRPHMVDPAQGWFVNWNNKPSADWLSTASSTWGAAQRVVLLADGMEAVGDNFKMSDVVEVAATAATQDSYAYQLWPLMAGSVTADGPAEQAALAALQAWVDGGSHRTDADRDDVQDHSTAVATWDTFMGDLLTGVFGDELGDISAYGFKPIDDAPHSNGSSYFFSLPDYLKNLLNGNAGRYSRDYCDNIDTDFDETCATQVQAAFDSAVAALVAEHGADPAAWEWDADYIEYTKFGAAAADPIPWQNRGTWNHIVEFHAP